MVSRLSPKTPRQIAILVIHPFSNPRIYAAIRTIPQQKDPGSMVERKHTLVNSQKETRRRQLTLEIPKSKDSWVNGRKKTHVS